MFESLLNKFQVRFKNREWAANILAESLKDLIKKENMDKDNIVVLGIPRGGVVTADVIAEKLNANFDILIPRKIAAPHNQELAIGAVMEDGTAYLNDELIRTLKISQEYIDKDKSEQIEEIRRRRLLYCNESIKDNDSSPTDDIIGKSKIVVLTDDGSATGATLIAAARWIKGKNLPLQLIIATPIAPKEIVSLLKKEANHVEVIIAPSTSSFKAVGQYYQSFEQVTDEQVVGIMRRRGLL